MVPGEKIDDLTTAFPTKRMYNLYNQIMKSGRSIALNIAEGWISLSNPDFRRFMGYSICSSAEVVTYFYKAKNRKYISFSTFDTLYKEPYDLMNTMVAFKRNIN